jgi:hypothetical protein
MRVLLIFILCLKVDCNELNVTNTKMNIKCENPRDCDSDYSECIKGFCNCKENYKVKKVGGPGPHCTDTSGCGPNQNCFGNICQYKDTCKEIGPTNHTVATQTFPTIVTNLTTDSNATKSVTNATRKDLKCDKSTKNCDSDNASDEIVLSFISIIFWFIFSFDIC